MTTAHLTDRDLLVAVGVVGDELREFDRRRIALAGEVGSREEVFRGAGHSRAALLLADVWKVTVGEAQRFVDVGMATRERVAIDGSALPARFEGIAQSLATLGVERAAIAVRELSRATCSFEARVEGEAVLVEHGAGFSVSDFAVLARQVRDRLDQDGAEPRDYLHRLSRLLRITELPSGMTKVVWEMPPETAGLVKAGIDAIVSSQLRTAAAEGMEDPRSFEQRRSDAAADIFRHAATCGHAGGDLPAITMVVRMSREELLTGAGFAAIDGVSETISAATARHLAAEAEFIPMVLDGHSLPLDYGHSRRLFSRAQKLAIIERDGGCAFPACASPPAYGEAHHLRWWSHGGSTDIMNGTSSKYVP